MVHVFFYLTTATFEKVNEFVQFLSLNMPSLTDKELEDVQIVIEEKSRKNLCSEI